MHIRKSLVFDKHSGGLVGFVNLGDINQHLMEFEKALSEDSSPPTMANSMTVFMLRGLFTSFTSCSHSFRAPALLHGDLVYDPFWEAVCRAERCGLKVCLQKYTRND